MKAVNLMVEAKNWLKLKKRFWLCHEFLFEYFSIENYGNEIQEIVELLKFDDEPYIYVEDLRLLILQEQVTI